MARARLSLSWDAHQKNICSGLSQMQQEPPDGSPPFPICQISNNQNSDTNTVLTKRENIEDSQHVAPMCKVYVENTYEDADLSMEELDSVISSQNSRDTTKKGKNEQGSKSALKTSSVQYLISNTGSLQLMFNRYIYHIRYTQKNQNRVWRCINYNSNRCHARVITNNRNEVVVRISIHNHPFHDGKILQKIRRGMTYAAIQEAEDQVRAIFPQRSFTDGGPVNNNKASTINRQRHN